MTETLAHGYSSESILSESYPMEIPTQQGLNGFQNACVVLGMLPFLAHSFF